MNGDPAHWVGRLQSGERRALARLLTFAESQKSEDKVWLDAFFKEANSDPGARQGGETSVRPLRIGITGIPGAGKSTLIDALGMHWVRGGSRVAVLAVDPSSVFTGGSILGDKLRMPRLGSSESAFVRPVPSAGALGGVTVNLDDAARLCELAGYHRILVETVGVGQSEVDVALLCDVLVMLVVPGTGDELQAVKRGITEVADILAVNKVDGAAEEQVRSLMAAYSEGLGLIHGANASIVACSATSGRGVAELADLIERCALTPKRPRSEKREALFRRLLEHVLLRRFWDGIGHIEEFLELVEGVKSERLTLRSAAEQALLMRGALAPTSAAQGNRA